MIPYPPAASGAWVAGAVTYAGYSSVQVNGRVVIYEARCTFLFSGATGGGTPVSGSEEVTLLAGPTPVNRDQHSVLVDGDSQTGIYGNQLLVIAAANPVDTI
jgi:hypothetical protein